MSGTPRHQSAMDTTTKGVEMTQHRPTNALTHRFLTTDGDPTIDVLSTSEARALGLRANKRHDCPDQITTPAGTRVIRPTRIVDEDGRVLAMDWAGLDERHTQWATVSGGAERVYDEATGDLLWTEYRLSALTTGGDRVGQTIRVSGYDEAYTGVVLDRMVEALDGHVAGLGTRIR